MSARCRGNFSMTAITNTGSPSGGGEGSVNPRTACSSSRRRSEGLLLLDAVAIDTCQPTPRLNRRHVPDCANDVCLVIAMLIPNRPRSSNQGAGKNPQPRLPRGSYWIVTGGRNQAAGSKRARTATCVEG